MAMLYAPGLCLQEMPVRFPENQSLSLAAQGPSDSFSKEHTLMMSSRPPPHKPSTTPQTTCSLLRTPANLPIAWLRYLPFLPMYLVLRHVAQDCEPGTTCAKSWPCTSSTLATDYSEDLFP